MVSDSVEPGGMVGFGNGFVHDRDFEMGLRRGSAAGTGGRKPSVEWDLGDFEFPDYKERMNAPL